jgi:hypothetical protein
MNKKVILFFASIFSIIGAYVPILFGDTDMLSGWSILGGLIGGFFGIWLGVAALKRWG